MQANLKLNIRIPEKQLEIYLTQTSISIPALLCGSLLMLQIVLLVTTATIPSLFDGQKFVLLHKENQLISTQYPYG